MTKKSLGALALSTLFACSAWAAEETYSYDNNGVYTDSKGFMLFEGLELDNVNYSNKEFGTDASASSAKRSPVKYANQTGFATLWFGGKVNTESVQGGPLIGDIVGGSTIKNSDFSGGTYTVESKYHDPSALMVYAGTTLENVNFSKSVFDNKSLDERSKALNLMGTLNSIDFSNTTISGATAVVGGGDKFNNVNFSNAVITGTSNIGMQLTSKEIQNLSIENAQISAQMCGLYASENIDGLNARNATFTVALAVAVDHNTTVTSADFRGAEVTLEESTHALGSSDLALAGNNSIVKNAMLGDGEIYSATNDWENGTSENLGLMLAEGETFTITAHETEAKLTVDSLVNGTIEIEVGADGNGKLLIAAGTQLTLSESAQIVVKLDDSVSSDLDLNTILAFEDGASLAIEGAGEGMTAQEALLRKISAQSTSGVELDNVTFSGTESVVQNVVVPEPSAFGLLAGIGALALVAARRRRR